MDKPEYPTMVVPVSEWDELQAAAEKLEAEVERLRTEVANGDGANLLMRAVEGR